MRAPRDTTKPTDKQSQQVELQGKAEQQRKIAEALKAEEAQKPAEKAKASKVTEKAGTAGAVEKKKTEKRRPFIEGVRKEDRDVIRRPTEKTPGAADAFEGKQAGKHGSLIDKVYPKPSDEQAGRGARPYDVRFAADIKNQTETFDKALKTAKDLLTRKRPADAEVAKRLDSLLKKLSNKNTDDSYIKEDSIFYQQFPEKRCPIRDLVQHARPKLEKAMTDPDLVNKGKGKYEEVAPSDDRLLGRLMNLDRDIKSGPDFINKKWAKEMGALNVGYKEVQKWMVQKTQQGNSILSLYSKVD